MITALENCRGRISSAFEIEIVDIDQHPGLEAKWGDKVPVLLIAEQEICHYFLDEAALQRAVSK
jgi:thioredoxin reductase (NADPH)